MSGLAIKILDVPVISVPQGPDVAEFCACELFCKYEELAFAKDGGDPHKKDFTSFLTRKITASDTITFKLFRDGVEVATISDDTYGTYYAAGDFANQPLYVGFVADWTKVFLALGGGLYQVKTEKTIAGTSSTFESRHFRVMGYSPEAAHRTVKLESYQTGNIIGNDLDFTGLVDGGWYSSIRMPGIFGDQTPTIEADEYLDTSYRKIQNRSQVTFLYEMRLENVPTSIYNVISEVDVLGNTLLITDYNLFADSIYRRIPVTPESFSDTEFYGNGRGSFSISFARRTQNTIKRNF